MVFLYDQVLNQPVSMIEGVVRAARPRKLLVVLTPEEVGRVLARLSGVYWLIACLRYGSGLRLIESVRLRVKDLDFQHRAVVVRDGKGGKDRVVTLADELIGPLQRHQAARLKRSHIVVAPAQLRGHAATTIAGTPLPMDSDHFSQQVLMAGG